MTHDHSQTGEILSFAEHDRACDRALERQLRSLADEWLGDRAGLNP